MKHTPAPWEFSELHIWRSFEESRKPNSPCPQIAYIGYGHNQSGELDEEQTANAILIEAAPELLQTCIDVRIMLMNQFGLFGGGEKLNGVFDVLNKIIDKATGEKQTA